MIDERELELSSFTEVTHANLVLILFVLIDDVESRGVLEHRFELTTVTR